MEEILLLFFSSYFGVKVFVGFKITEFNIKLRKFRNPKGLPMGWGLYLLPGYGETKLISESLDRKKHIQSIVDFAKFNNGKMITEKSKDGDKFIITAGFKRDSGKWLTDSLKTWTIDMKSSKALSLLDQYTKEAENYCGAIRKEMDIYTDDKEVLQIQRNENEKLLDEFTSDIPESEPVKEKIGGMLSFNKYLEETPNRPPPKPPKKKINMSNPFADDFMERFGEQVMSCHSHVVPSNNVPVSVTQTGCYTDSFPRNVIPKSNDKCIEGNRELLKVYRIMKKGKRPSAAFLKQVMKG